MEKIIKLYLELQTNVYFAGQPWLDLVNQTHFLNYCERSESKLNLSWADHGDLVIKRYFETGPGYRHDLVRCQVSDVRCQVSGVAFL